MIAMTPAFPAMATTAVPVLVPWTSVMPAMGRQEQPVMQDRMGTRHRR
jgi:hypothetical protein